MQEPSGRISARLLLFAVVVVGFALRLYHLDLQSLWLDEAFSFHVASHNDIFALLSQVTREDNHPPLYYIILGSWISLAGHSEFAGRFVSVMAGTLSIPLMAKFGASLFGRRTGYVAAGLLAVSPFHLWYSQEARMYALVCLLAIVSVLCCLEFLKSGRRELAVGYVLATVLMMLSHYYGIFVLLFENVAFFAFGRRKVSFKGWLAAQGAVALLFAPWLLSVMQQFSRAPHDYQLPVSLLDVARNISVTFSVGDQPSRWIEPVHWIFASVVGLGIAGSWRATRVITRSSVATGGDRAALYQTWDEECHFEPQQSGGKGPRILGDEVIRFVQNNVSRSVRDGPVEGYSWVFSALYLVAIPVLAYLVSLALSMNLRAGLRMHYIVALPAYLLLLSLGLARLARWATVLGILGAVLLFSVSLASTADQFFVRQKEDWRSTVSYVEENERSDETIVLNAEHIYPAFSYYYHGSLTWHRAEVGDAESTSAFLDQVTAGKESAWLVLSREDLSDPRGLVKSWFDRHGLMIDDRWFSGGRVLRYSLEPRPNFLAPAVPNTIEAVYGNKIALIGYDVPSGVKSSSRLSIKLVWRSLAKADEDYRAVVYLMDGSGRVWSQSDHVPIVQAYGTSHWVPGEYLTDNFYLNVPLGTPPGQYDLKVRLYSPLTGTALKVDGSGQEFVSLTKLTVVKADSQETARALSSLSISARRNLNDDVAFLGGRASKTEALAGEDVGLSLLWQARRKPQARYDTLLQVVDGSNLVSQETRATLGGEGYPADRWDAGEVVRDNLVLHLSDSLSEGEYHLQARLVTDGKTTAPVDLGVIFVRSPDRSFETPHPQYAYDGTSFGGRIAFLGYDISSRVVMPGDKMHLSTYWKALEKMDMGYKVFVHLLGAGNKVVAQEDAFPLKGSRPTTSWSEGEVVRDEHDITVPDDAPPGEYRLEIGFYNPQTGERLLVLDSGPQASENAVLLKESIAIK